MTFRKIMTIRVLSIIFCLQFFNGLTFGQKALKREFRGVWIATVTNIDWPSSANLSSESQQNEFRNLLNEHKKNGINAVIVQVRPSADALYKSTLEPWSEWLTGTQGKKPDPEYDPLAFMIEEAHQRGMEFHAWLNPYRAIFDANKFYQDPKHIHLDSLKNLIQNLVNSGSDTSSGILTKKEYMDLITLLEADTSLLLYKHPDWFLQYGNKIYFDPGIPEVQQHITRVVEDIVVRYDVDAIHMDDYFYPYKIAGIEFPDSLSFRIYGSEYSPEQKDYWRRENVNTIVQHLNETIKTSKPHVKFGISPFGVWRNASVDPTGSATKAGQTNYDDLYADVLKWQKEKWIDYVIPQIYWHRGFELADYGTLAKWWNDNHYGVQVYIGLGVYRIEADSKTEAWRNPREIAEQIAINRALPNIQGSCFYSSKPMINNPLGVTDILKGEFFQYPAFVPEMNWLESSTLSPPQILTAKNTRSGVLLEWTGDGKYYVVYRFKGKHAGDANDPSNIISFLGRTSTFFEDKSVRRFKKYTYTVSAMNESFSESELSSPIGVRWKRLRKPGN